MWHTKETEEVLRELNVDQSIGLSESEAKHRIEQHGPNKLEAKKKRSIIELFVSQLRDWLIYVLFAAVIITAFMGEYVDSIIIIAVIIINATLGVIQEVKAGKAIEALQKISSPKALVKREGKVFEIESERLVPGDILILDAGRYVAADIRLTESVNLKIEESSLTGESVPSDKIAQTTYPQDTPLGDRENMAYMTNLVTYGRGEGVVIATGMNTEVGKIANFLDEDGESKTPLEIRLDELGKMLGKIAIAICAFIFVISLLQGRDLAEMFLTAVSLAVASIPEGLAAIVAVVLSIGVTAMSKKNAIIKRLPAVETLGSVNIICTDKTGTLTQNKMTVIEYFTHQNEGVIKDLKSSDINQDLELLVKSMVLSSDATLDKDKSTGDPTEIALLVLADDLKIDRSKIHSENKRINEVPFDSDRKMMSTVVKEGNTTTVYTKGAIDNLLNVCNRVHGSDGIIELDEKVKDKFREAAENMSDKALRTLGVAYKVVNSKIKEDEIEKELILIGIVGMIDPARDEARPSIEKAHQAGIEVVMITGDHRNTAYAIASNLNIAQNFEQSVTGRDIEKFTDEEFAGKVMNYRVFSRVSPEHKVKIVKALKANGNIVSMTGDGVNDAPSLNAADIGVAMGITGTDVAKGASDMILTDDNFSTIVTAIEQGRNIYNNIKKSVIFLLTCNLGEVVAMLTAILIGWPVPLIATQLLWINLLTDSFPAIALGMDPGDPDVMKEKPRNPKESFFANGATQQAVIGGVIIGVLTISAFWFGFYEHGYRPNDPNVPKSVISYSRTMAFMVLVASQMFYALTMRSKDKSIFKLGIFTNKYLVGAIIFGIVAQLFVIEIPFMREAFGLQMLDLQGWLVAITFGLLPLLINETIKGLRKIRSRQ